MYTCKRYISLQYMYTLIEMYIRPYTTELLTRAA